MLLRISFVILLVSLAAGCSPEPMSAYERSLMSAKPQPSIFLNALPQPYTGKAAKLPAL